MPVLDISNVVNVSVATPQLGANNYNTSNVALFSDELPGPGFPGTGYAFYLDPSEVEADFGTGSRTAQMADKVFAQAPNMLAGGGQLIVISVQEPIQKLLFSAVSASGHFTLSYNGNVTGNIQWNDTASTIQSALRQLPGLSQVVVTGSIASESVFIQMWGVYKTSMVSFVAVSSLLDGGSAPVNITVSTSTAGEGVPDAMTRTMSTVQWFAAMANETHEVIGATDAGLVQTIVQAVNRMFFDVTSTEADIQSPNGFFFLNQTAKNTHYRGLFYDDNTNGGLNELFFMAGYVGRMLSVDFTGSNTTITTHGKVLNGVVPDPNITQSILNEAQAAGVDCYVNLQGDPAVFASKANLFFDQVYNLLWYVGALQIAVFNYLFTVSTKIAQTEDGMNGMKGVCRDVSELAVFNGYSAPGKWTASTPFGNQADFLSNIAQRGFYIFSEPIAQQLQTDRAARKAPLIQVALKEAGAIHSASIIVNINA